MIVWVNKHFTEEIAWCSAIVGFCRRSWKKTLVAVLCTHATFAFGLFFEAQLKAKCVAQKASVLAQMCLFALIPEKRCVVPYSLLYTSVCLERFASMTGSCNQQAQEKHKWCFGTQVVYQPVSLA